MHALTNRHFCYPNKQDDESLQNTAHAQESTCVNDSSKKKSIQRTTDLYSSSHTHIQQGTVGQTNQLCRIRLSNVCHEIRALYQDGSQLSREMRQYKFKLCSDFEFVQIMICYFSRKPSRFWNESHVFVHFEASKHNLINKVIYIEFKLTGI